MIEDNKKISGSGIMKTKPIPVGVKAPKSVLKQAGILKASPNRQKMKQAKTKQRKR
jgi:hypothetical protein